MTGGSFFTTKDLMDNIGKNHEVYLLSAEDGSFRLYKHQRKDFKLIKEYPRNYQIQYSGENSRKWSAGEFHNSWLTHIYFDVLLNLDIDLIHIMHLINHSFDLPQVAKKLDIPVILSIHDFYYLCPFYTLLDENLKYCGGKCGDNSKNCYLPMKSLSDINSKEFIGTWRKNVSEMFNNVDVFISTSHIIKDLFVSFYPNIINDKNFKIIEHGRDLKKIRRKLYEVPKENKPIKILCFANHLNEMKGSGVIRAIKAEDKDNKLEFHFLGNAYGLDDCGISHGRFKRQDLPKKVKLIRPSFVGIFSIWPESYCYALTESWICGIPILGSNIGVVEDRIKKNDGGWIIDIDDSKKNYDRILEIARDEDEYLRVAKNVKEMSFKTTYEMAMEYKEIYESIIDKD